MAPPGRWRSSGERANSVGEMAASAAEMGLGVLEQEVDSLLLLALGKHS